MTHDVSTLPLVDPSDQGGLVRVFQRRYLLTLLVRREISARYQGTFLGLFWSYVQPASRFFIYFFVFGMVLHRGNKVDDFAIHLFAGLVIVHFFTESFNAGTKSIVANKSLVRRLALPREMFPVASMLVSLFHTLPAVGILLVATTLSGWRPDPVGLAAGVLGITIAAILGTALALILSVGNALLRDVSRLTQTLTQFMHFFVPMMYPYTMIVERFGGGWVREVYMANPLVESVLLFQRCFWTGATSDPSHTATYEMPPDLWTRGFIMFAVSILVLIGCQLAFTRLEGRIPERLN